METTVKLEMFEGPLDLLLHLIKKSEVSITDIPIATITEQYLSTLELMESLNLDVAGEFLVMAATLIHLKSRMLLPPEADEDEEEEEGEDPRAELIRKLLEYRRFKDAAEGLERREILSRDVFARSQPEFPEEKGAVEFESVSLFDLLSALRDVLERFPKEAFHEVTVDRITVRETMNLLLDDLHRRGKLIFQALFEQATSRIEVIVTFLAMLELVKIRAVRIWQEGRFEPIVIELAAPVGEIQEKMATEVIDGEGHGE